MRDREDTPSFQIKFRWSPNAFRGFGAAMVLASIVIGVSMCTSLEPPEPYDIPRTTPVTLLVFGDGDGTGARKGNLTEEGDAQTGQDAKNPLMDAQKAAASDADISAEDIAEAISFIPVKEVGRSGEDNDDADAADETIGSEDGRDGPGLGMAGTGRGRGPGYGDIDWGGGGNRIATNKVMPKFPPGTMNTQVKLKFRVRPDGSVSFVMPVRRSGNPATDAAAMRAMRRWRFNSLSDSREMEGTITFVFRSS